MKKVNKILSGSLLVALMSIGLVTKMDVKNDKHLDVRDVLTEDVTKDVTGKAVRRAGEAPVAENKVSEVKAQVSEELEGKRSIRFVAGIDSYDYYDVTFNVSMALDGEEDKSWSHTVTMAYERVVANGEELTAAEAFGEDYKYLVAFTINNVPQAYWDKAFEVSTSVKQNEEAAPVVSGIVNKVVDEIVALDKEEISKPEAQVISIMPDAIDVYGVNHIKIVFNGTVQYVKDSPVCYISIASSPRQVDGSGNWMTFFSGGPTLVGEDFDVSVSFKGQDGNNYVSNFSVSDGKIVTLDSYKSNAIDTLNGYLDESGYTSNLYTEENWSAIQSLLASGAANINAATSTEEVDVALANACAAIDAVEQRDLGLEEVKTNAVNELNDYVDSLVQSKYTTENWTVIQGLKDNCVSAINASENEDAIATLLQTCKNEIAAVEIVRTVKKLTFNGNLNAYAAEWFVVGWTNAELAINDKNVSYNVTNVNDTAVVKAVVYDENNNEYAANVNRADGARAMHIQCTDFNNKVGSLQSNTFVVYIKVTIGDSIFQLYVKKVANGGATQVDGIVEKTLDDIKTDAIKELNEYPNQENYSNENWVLVQEKVALGTTNINNANSKDEVAAALSNAKANIDLVQKEVNNLFVHDSTFDYNGEAALGTGTFAWWNWRYQENLGDDTVASYDEATNSFKYKSTSPAKSDSYADTQWWHDQFFYKLPNLSGNVTVEFDLVITGIDGGSGVITINGSRYTVTNGETLKVSYTTNATTTINIQLGNSADNSNLTGLLELTMSNIVIYK